MLLPMLKMSTTMITMMLDEYKIVVCNFEVLRGINTLGTFPQLEKKTTFVTFCLLSSGGNYFALTLIPLTKEAKTCLQTCLPFRVTIPLK